MWCCSNVFTSSQERKSRPTIEFLAESADLGLVHKHTSESQSVAKCTNSTAINGLNTSIDTPC